MMYGHTAWAVIAALHLASTTMSSQLPLVDLDHTGPNQSDGLRLSLSSKWDVLGPFRIGTRESTWGADPLEAHGHGHGHGGFSSLTPDPQSTFASALGLGGNVSWSTYHKDAAVGVSERNHRLRTDLDISFPYIDWAFLQSVYGWAALQYQAWARGYLHVHGDGDETVTVQIFTDGLLELRIDGDEHFGGDFYGFRRAPLILRLTPGEHIVELRLVRDTRKDGAVGADLPSVSCVFEIAVTEPCLTLDTASTIVPEVVDGRLAGDVGSIVAHNAADEWIEVTQIRAKAGGNEDEDEDLDLNLNLSLLEAPLVFAPRQSRPVAFAIENLATSSISSFSIALEYRVVNSSSDAVVLTNPTQIHLVSKPATDAHRFTFTHPSGIVSYAILRAPNNPTCSPSSNSHLPVLLGLHGAGLDADTQTARHMLHATHGICAWLLLPTGGTSWSGDDWHTWGTADVKAAIEGIPFWIEHTNWTGPGVAIDDWIIVGHSNGGQGAWVLLTHEPDKIVAAAPVSGYSSIENYVPYTLWRDGDAMLEAVFRVARQAWKHELLIENFAGVPVLQQHGSADDNVPVYHSRLMRELALAGSSSTRYHELSGEPHWRDGVLETSHLLEFYRHHASKPTHELPTNFSLIVPAAGSIGPRGGIAVEQLTSPHRAGRIDVSRRGGDGLGSSWVLKTQNIRSFHIRRCAAIPSLKEVQIDGHKYDLHTSTTTYFVKDKKSWTVTDSAQGISSIAQRSGRQVGSLDAILRSNGRFSIVCAKRTTAIAVQISRNFLQYYGADSQIVGLDTRSDAIGNTTGNIITVVQGRDCPPLYTGSRSPGVFPVRITDEAIIVEGKDEEEEGASAIYGIQPGRFVVTLRPLPDQRLELLVWGADGEAVRYASRLVPMVTGTGQPDFIVGDAGELRVRGAGGVLAAGFFDWQWKVARGSYVTQ